MHTHTRVPVSIDRDVFITMSPITGPEGRDLFIFISIFWYLKKMIFYWTGFTIRELFIDSVEKKKRRAANGKYIGHCDRRNKWKAPIRRLPWRRLSRHLQQIISFFYFKRNFFLKKNWFWSIGLTSNLNLNFKKI